MPGASVWGKGALWAHEQVRIQVKELADMGTGRQAVSVNNITGIMRMVDKAGPGEGWGVIITASKLGYFFQPGMVRQWRRNTGWREDAWHNIPVNVRLGGRYWMP